MKNKRYVHVSFIISNTTGEILEMGMNRIESNSPCSVHSEEDAWYSFKRSRKRLGERSLRYSQKALRKGVTMVNLAVTKTYIFRMSKPCSRCARLIQKQSGYITRVYWTTGCDTIEWADSEDVHLNSAPSSGDRM